MLLNLKAATWEKLRHLANAQGMSAATLAAKIIDDLVEEKVKTVYQLTEENEIK